MNAYTVGLLRSDAALTVFPSWPVRLKPGTASPAGRTAPAQPFVWPVPPSSPLIASDAPITAAAAHTDRAMRTSRRRAGTARPRLGLRAPGADRVAHKLHAIAHAELAQQVRAVRLDGLLGEVERLGDLLVRVRLGDQLQDLLLARRQRLVGAGRVVAHPLAHDRALDRVGEEGLAAVHGADRVQQRLVDLALEHIAGCAGLQRVEHVALVVVH